MVKKFSVGIPDDLATRLEPFKDKISPTAVFQEAMAARIGAFEERKKRMEGEDMEAIIERLRKQKAESDKNLFADGEEIGMDFAKSADYDELKYAATVMATSTEPWQLAFARDGILGDYFDDLEDDEGYPLFANMPPADVETWFRGWCASVRQFWDKVSASL